MMNIDVNREPTMGNVGATANRSRLDDILIRHRRRQVRTVTLLVLWTVLCGALLAT